MTLLNTVTNVTGNLVDLVVDTNTISFDLGENAGAITGNNIAITPDSGEVITIAADDPQVSILDGVVTISLTNDLLNGTNYTIEIVDALGDVVEGILPGDDNLNFTTVLDNVTNLPVDANISFDLGENVGEITGNNIAITPDGGEVITIAADDPQVSILDGVVTINLTNDLLPGTNYTIEIVDALGDVVEGILSGDDNLNFTTVLDNVTNLPVDANISFDLGENVGEITGKNIAITPDGGEVITIAADDPQVSILDGVVTINLTNDLLPDTNYIIEIVDALGDVVDGILPGDGILNFITEDTIAPTVTGPISPSDNAMDVAVDADISFNLGESVTPVDGENITITPEGGEPIIIAADDMDQVTINPDGLVTINPTDDLMNGKNYTVTIDPGAFIDDAGNEFKGKLTTDDAFNFMTVAAANNGGSGDGGSDNGGSGDGGSDNGGSGDGGSGNGGSGDGGSGNGGSGNGGNTTIMPINTTNTDTNGNVMEVIDLTEFAGQTVTGSFEINREADYNNNVYFYRIDNNNGDIGSLTPDASGYLQTALNNVINPTQELTTTDETTTTKTFDIAGGSILGIVMVADGTLEQAQSNLDSVKGVYFSFLGANTDNGTFDHIRLNGNTFEFEDLANGGDSDFNDFGINMDFTV